MSILCSALMCLAVSTACYAQGGVSVVQDSSHVHVTEGRGTNHVDIEVKRGANGEVIGIEHVPHIFTQPDHAVNNVGIATTPIGSGIVRRQGINGVDLGLDRLGLDRRGRELDARRLGLDRRGIGFDARRRGIGFDAGRRGIGFDARRRGIGFDARRLGIERRERGFERRERAFERRRLRNDRRGNLRRWSRFDRERFPFDGNNVGIDGIRGLGLDLSSLLDRRDLDLLNRRGLVDGIGFGNLQRGPIDALDALNFGRRQLERIFRN